MLQHRDWCHNLCHTKQLDALKVDQENAEYAEFAGKKVRHRCSWGKE
jgi:hypothetical protein